MWEGPSQDISKRHTRNYVCVCVYVYVCVYVCVCGGGGHWTLVKQSASLTSPCLYNYISMYLYIYVLLIVCWHNHGQVITRRGCTPAWQDNTTWHPTRRDLTWPDVTWSHGVTVSLSPHGRRTIGRPRYQKKRKKKKTSSSRLAVISWASGKTNRTYFGVRRASGRGSQKKIYRISSVWPCSV